MLTQSEKKTLRILSSIIFWFYVLSFVLIVISKFFNEVISNWLRDHFVIAAASWLLLLSAIFIGLLKYSDFDLLSFNDFLLLLSQVVISYNFLSIKENIGPGVGLLIVLFLPTLIFLLRSYFTRLHRIEKLLEDIVDKIPIEKWDD